MTLRKQLKNVKDPECRDHIVILYKGLSNQRTTWSGKRRSEECRSGDSHLERPPRIMGFIHARNVCQKEVFDDMTNQSKKNKILLEPPWMASQDHGIHSFKECVPEGSDYFQQTLERRRSSTHNKRREYWSNWRYLKRWGIRRTQLLKNLLSMLAFG